MMEARFAIRAGAFQLVEDCAGDNELVITLEADDLDGIYKNAHILLGNALKQLGLAEADASEQQ